MFAYILKYIRISISEACSLVGLIWTAFLGKNQQSHRQLLYFVNTLLSGKNIALQYEFLENFPWLTLLLHYQFIKGLCLLYFLNWCPIFVSSALCLLTYPQNTGKTIHVFHWTSKTGGKYILGPNQCVCTNVGTI